MSQPISHLDPESRPTLSVDETAIVFDISRTTAYEAIRNGEIPSLRFGRRLRVPTAEVRRMLALGDTPSAA